MARAAVKKETKEKKEPKKRKVVPKEFKVLPKSIEEVVAPTVTSSSVRERFFRLIDYSDSIKKIQKRS